MIEGHTTQERLPTPYGNKEYLLETLNGLEAIAKALCEEAKAIDDQRAGILKQAAAIRKLLGIPPKRPILVDRG